MIILNRAEHEYMSLNCYQIFCLRIMKLPAVAHDFAMPSLYSIFVMEEIEFFFDNRRPLNRTNT